MLGATRGLVRFLAFFFLRGFRRLERISRSVAFATFTHKELDALAVAEWEAFGDEGPVTGQALFAWEVDLFARHIQPGDSLLIVGAGSGRDVLPLLEAGHAVTALDITPQALALLELRAGERGLHVGTICASITEADLPEGKFDVVLFSWFTLGYVRGQAARARALAKSRNALASGGRIVISYIAGASTNESNAGGSPLASAVARALGGIEISEGDHVNLSGSAARPGIFMSHTFKPGPFEDEVRGLGFEIVEHSHPASGVGVLVLRPAPRASL